MKYTISRASGSDREDGRPCEDAVLDAETQRWTIDLNTLEEFTDFCDKYGDIIIRGNTIIIYDDYVE